MTETAADHPSIFLLPGHDKRVGHGHPWAFSNEVRMDAAAKELAPGSVATLHRVDGKPLGLGTFNPHALICFRRLAGSPRARIDTAFLAERLGRALRLRERLFAEPFYRWVHAEADGLPGWVIDRYGATVVIQAGTAGAEALEGPLLDALDRVAAPATVVFRNDGPARALEGLASEVRVARGTVDGPLELRENGLVFLADVEAGQKTGWFYDQRDNRTFATRLVPAGGRVLDVYCHTGGFALVAAAAGAGTVIGVDGSERAIALADAAAARNGLAERCAFVKADAFKHLETLGETGERFDVVVTDPPAFAKSRKDVGPALKGYRKLAKLASRLIKPEGFLVAATCSHHVEPARFAEEVARGLAQSGRVGRIVHAAGAAPDHPVHPFLPESAYLKLLVMQVD